MKAKFDLVIFVALQVVLAAIFCIPTQAQETGWLCLTDPSSLQPLPLTMSWQHDHEDWTVAGDAELDTGKPRKLIAKPGQGVLISSLEGQVDFRNLTSRQWFKDLEVHVEFLIPKGSNAGVKLQGLYEIQIRDSHDVKIPNASDCGGVYPRAELEPSYHTIDQGVPPRTNAAKPAGEWQSLDIQFQAPRFDVDGKKTANAHFLKVVLNGQTIHEDIELKWPTGHAWRNKPEVPRGPLFLQGDHGPVAYRNVRVRIPESP
jgi:3-keto-disaccharide hydrolase